MPDSVCANCGSPKNDQDLDFLSWCEDCLDDPTCENSRHDAERDDAAERKMEANETARQDAE